MGSKSEDDKVALIEKSVAQAGSAETADPEFIRALYRNVPPEDLLAQSPDDLLQAGASLLRFIQERRPGRPKVQILGPEEPGQAWANGRTVIRAVNDDMPFLVDSVTQALNARNLVVHLVIHPILAVERDASGRLLRILHEGGNAPLESVMQVELDGVVDEATRTILLHDLEAVLGDVRAAVVDWALMSGKAERIAHEVGLLPIPATDAAELSAFMAWLTDRNFTFLGYREYRIEGSGITIASNTSLGLLRDETFQVFDGFRRLPADSPVLKTFVETPGIVTFSKSTRLSTVHRRVPMDTVGVKSFDDNGVLNGQKLFVGLFTSHAYTRPLESVPILRTKLERIMDRSGFAADSHDGKSLRHILDSLPRDELLQFSEDELLTTALGILNLQERQRIALFLRYDPYGRFVSCLVYVPRDRYSASVRARMAAILAEAFGGSVLSETTHLDESILARLHLSIGNTDGPVPRVDAAALEQKLIEAGQTWSDRLRDALTQRYDNRRADELASRYAEAFPGGYTERTDPAAAVRDLALMETLLGGQPIALRMEIPEGGAPSLRTIHAGEPLPLSDVLPMIENFGLRVITEIPYATHPRGVPTPMWVQQFEMMTRDGALPAADAGPRFEEAFAHIWSGNLENDGFNRLVMLAGLTARQVVVLRTYCKVLRQAGSAFSQAYMEDTLAAHPAIARQLFELFEAQFDPARKDADRGGTTAEIGGAIEASLDQVSNLDEDRILRSYLLLIRRSLRTNYYQLGADGQLKPYLSIKFASREIDLFPLPRPLVEVFVYSPRIEGCHLRGGRVARGGLRWSDRKEDFRTEVLGLMKAQMVKNAVIVPVGSKGGFVVKRPPLRASREVMMAEVVSCYRTFISGLLDITDDFKGGAVVPPTNVVRRDADDPYLVVAADKGTATFSDIANGVARDYGFWLDDAFASGGSVGYDHKRMGITSRGAWEAVKRHFRELGRDIQTSEFTCVGIGDMSGDVFGNGMLLSQHTKLVAAFNHMHIVIDPDPDPATTWAERKRLFDMPRSSWSDYDKSLLSRGGAIYERSAKSITLSPEAQARFGLEKATMTPAELVHQLLRAPVDLLWLGGIGTYVKASTETNAEAGDKANDGLRVNGADLRAKVVGEGANLGVTQRGRIEYALRGGRINTDAIDNSAGVDTSDHEVNIKIGVGELIASGFLNADQRPTFLASLTDEVAVLVLKHNYLQTLAISLAEAEAPQLLDQHARLMRALEREGRLDRAVEFLPDSEAIAQRASIRWGLTRPELAVLLAYAKLALKDDLLGSDLPDDPALRPELMEYFPATMRTVSPETLDRHQLRREIIVTVIANAIINRSGPGFVADMQARTGRHAADLGRAWMIVRDAFDLGALWQEIEGLDNRCPSQTQTALFLAVQHATEQACRWLLQSGLRLNIPAQVAAFRPAIASLASGLADLLPEAERTAHDKRRSAFLDGGIDVGLAERVTDVETLATSLDVLTMEVPTGATILDLGQLYFAVGDRLGLLALRRLAADIPALTSWQRMASGALADDFASLQRDIVQHVLVEGDGPLTERFTRWLERHAQAAGELQDLLEDMRRTQPPDLAMLMVASRQLRTLSAA